jgi:hypothetical protein
MFPDFDYQKLIFVQNKCVIRNQHWKLHRITYVLSKNIFRQNSTVLVYPDFDYQKLIFVQNKCVIRNQHWKLHRTTYILSKNIFRQNSTVLPPRCFLLNFNLWSPSRSNFVEKYFLIKHMLFDVVFNADSE